MGAFSGGFASTTRENADLVLRPASGAQATVYYQVNGTVNAGEIDAAELSQIEVDLTPTTPRAIVPTGVLLGLGSESYVDRAGSIYRAIDRKTGAGTLAGTIDYSTGKALLTHWSAGATSLSVRALATMHGDWISDAVVFRTPGSPIRSGSLQIRANQVDGTLVQATADTNGNIVAAGVTGVVDTEMGLVSLAFDPPILPDTLVFNCVILTYLPLDADQLGLDPVRLPLDGRVPIFRVGDVVVVHHTASTNFANPAVAGSTLDVGRTRLASLIVEDAVGTEIAPALYTVNLNDGEVTLADPLDLTGYVQPLRVVHRIEDMSIATDVQITGYLNLQRALSHDFPLGTLVSSALIVGDMQARYANLFEQTTWTSVWSNTLIGSAPSGQFNDTLYPIAVTNRGTITERWALIFTSTTAFRVVGEFSGEIAQGNTATTCAPVNPNTGVAYFTINPLGWGAGGWAVGNVLRFNTVGADFPLWIARTVLQAEATGDSDYFRLQIRGNANA